MNRQSALSPAGDAIGDAGPQRRVVFLGLEAYGAHGGIQRFNRRVIEALGDLAVPTTVLMKNDTAAVVPADSGTMRFVGAKGLGRALLGAFFDAARGADVLLLGHINLLPFAALFRMLNPRGKVLMFAHGVEVWGDPVYRRPRRWEGPMLRRAVDRIAVVSAYSRERMSRTFRLDREQFSLFPNTVSVDAAARPVIVPEASATVLCVSRLGVYEREKHVAELIRAMAKVRETNADARLVIVGDGPLRAELEALSRELGLQDAVRFAGFVSDEELARAYEEAALFALPSSKEGFGIVYLEAWLKGLPVIGSRFGAGAEVITDGVDGRTVDPRDIDALADAITGLLGDPGLRADMAARGWDKVSTQYCDAVLRRNLAGLIALPTRAG